MTLKSRIPFGFLPGWLLLLSLPSANWAFAQGTRSDYERANKLAETTRNKVFRDKVTPHWLGDNRRFWYRNDLPGGAREFILVDAEKGVRLPAFDHQRMAQALTKETGKAISATHLPVDRLEFPAADSVVILRGSGRAWQCDLRDYSLRPAPAGTAESGRLKPLASEHPSRRTGAETFITFANRTQGSITIHWVNASGARQSYGNLRPGAEHRQHTFAGHVWAVTDAQGQFLACFEAAEDGGLAVIEPGTRAQAEKPKKTPEDQSPENRSPDGRWQAFFQTNNLHLRNLQTREEFALTRDGSAEHGYAGRVHWSPDSTRLVALRTRKGDDRKVYYVESSPKDQLQPRLHSYNYLKPGDRIPLSKPHLFAVENRRAIPVSDELFPNPWSISDLQWDPDSRRFTFLYNQRGHQVLRWIAVDARSGQATAIIDEKSDTFIDYAGKKFLRYLPKTGEAIWMSERDGWNHLYLYDARAGKVKNQVTRGPWVVRGVETVDEEKRQIWFRAGGFRPGQDPYYVHYGRVNFDGTGLVMLTEGDGHHAVQFSPDRRFLVDTWSRVDLPPVSELRRADNGSLVCELERADATELLKTGWRAPERFVAKGRDGATDIYGVIWRPMKLDPARRYPVIEDIYAGPHGAFVPKSFSAYHKAQSLAELGFIVVKMDGMGTSHRSKQFHDVCWKNLGDSGFPDRILWIKAAAAKYPYLDLERVGIFGGSAGGQSATRALLAHGDFYKVAVADCGCHDNRMDKIWWNELWMGWPLGPHYEEQSNVTQAHKLQGKLMLVVGEMDENVDPASTMQVVNALIKADKDFDLLVMTGAGHGAAETPYANRRRQDFFVRHLLGVEPRRQP